MTGGAVTLTPPPLYVTIKAPSAGGGSLGARGQILNVARTQRLDLGALALRGLLQNELLELCWGGNEPYITVLLHLQQNIDQSEASYLTN